jgi:hypothetical protein
MNMVTGTANYRNTGIFLSTVKSMRGSSKVEVVHGVMDRSFYAVNNLRQLSFDARAHWCLTNYNRERLRALGKEALPAGVAPSEGNPNLINLVPHTDMRFGFDYYQSVLAELDRSITMSALELVESSEGLDDILDMHMAAVDGVMDDEDLVGDVDSAIHVVPAEDLNPLTATIPATVGLDDIEKIGRALNNDIEWSNTSLPVAADERGATQADVTTTFSRGVTFDECLEGANARGREAGIDVDTHFADTGSDKFKRASSANGIRNVGLRRQQSQEVQPVRPDLNDDMLKKWTELWAQYPNPSNGATMKGWYQQNNLAYEQWRIRQLFDAEKAGVTPPPLLPVNYTNASAWAEDMKKRMMEPLKTGAIDEESRTINNQMTTYINSTDGEANVNQFTEGAVGSAISSSTLSIQPPTNNTTTFTHPTTSVVRRELERPDSTSNKSLPAAKKRPPKPVDLELVSRRAAAATKMGELNLVQAPPNKSTRRCQVCFQSKTAKLGDVPHAQLERTERDERIKTFCPFADDIAIWEQISNKRKENRSGWNKAMHARKKARNSTNDDT